MFSAIPISVYVAISLQDSSPPFILVAMQRSWSTRSAECPRVTVLSGPSFFLYCPPSGNGTSATYHFYFYFHFILFFLLPIACCSRSGAMFVWFVSHC